MTTSTVSADKALNQAQRPVVQALMAALPKGTVILGGAVTERSAGIWRSDQIQAQVLVRPKTTEEAARSGSAMNIIKASCRMGA